MTYWEHLSLYHFAFGSVIILDMPAATWSWVNRAFFSFLLVPFVYSLFFVASSEHLRWFTQSSCLLMSKQRSFGLPFFLAFFNAPSRIWFSDMPGPLQKIAESFGWSSGPLDVPIVLALLRVVYRDPRQDCSHFRSPGLQMRWLKISDLSNPASKPWNFCIVVAHAGMRGQHFTVHHFLLHGILWTSIGTCCVYFQENEVSFFCHEILFWNHIYSQFCALSPTALYEEASVLPVLSCRWVLANEQRIDFVSGYCPDSAATGC